MLIFEKKDSMKKSLLLFSVMAVFMMLSATGMPQNSAENAPETLDLSLAEALQQANKMNTYLKQAQIDWELAKNSYETKFYKISFPTFGFVLSAESPLTVHQVAGSEAWDSRKTLDSRRRGQFNGEIGFGISQFNLFNSWIDTIDLKVAEIAKERAALTYLREKRNAKFEVISAYFELFRTLKNEEIAGREVNLSKAILRLIKAKKKRSQIEDSDVESAELEVARAEKRLLTAQTQSFENRYAFIKTLGWDTNTQFRLTTEPRYYDLKISLENVRKTYEASSEDLQSSKLGVEDAELKEDRAYRERFPVKVTISAVNWLHRFGNYADESVIETGTTPQGNVDLTLNISVDIPIWGADGLANQSPIKEQILNRKNSEEGLRRTRMNGLLDVASVYGRIIRNKGEINASRENLLKSTALLTRKMQEPLTDQGRRLELKDLLSSTRDLEVEYYDKTISYNELVMRLSNLVGKDLTEGAL